MDVKQLNKNIKGFWKGQENTGHQGLKLLNNAMLHFAEHGDWTPLARFLDLSGKEKASLFKIVKASFGPDNISSKPDKKGEFGFRLVKGWEGNGFDLAGRNGYGIVRQAIDDNKSFRSQDFLKSINEVMGKDAPEKKDKTALEAMEVIYKYLTAKMKDDQDLKAELTDLVSGFEKRIEAVKAKHEPDF